MIHTHLTVFLFYDSVKTSVTDERNSRNLHLNANDKHITLFQQLLITPPVFFEIMSQV